MAGTIRGGSFYKRNAHTGRGCTRPTTVEISITPQVEIGKAQHEIRESYRAHRWAEFLRNIEIMIRRRTLLLE